MNGMTEDIRHALRSLLRQRLITVMAVLTLGLGIGANTAIFTVLDATLLSPPPYQDPDSLVAIWGALPSRDIDEWPAAPQMIDRYQRSAELFEDFAGGFNLNHVYQRQPDAEPEQVTATGVTWNMFALLGVPPMVGRDFTAADAAFSRDDVLPGAQPPLDAFNPAKTVILGHAFWQSRFRGDPGVVGSTLYLDGQAVTVAGVMPPRFQLLLPGGGEAAPDLFEAMRVDLSRSPAANVFMTVLGRLKPGVSLAQAQSEMDAITTTMIENIPVYREGGFYNRVIPLHEELTEDIDAVVWLLSGAVALILLIACANVANLLLVRATSRRREVAIRAALGCSRWRLFRYGLVEAGLVAIAGGILGVVLAAVALPMLVAMQPQTLPQLSTLEIDIGVLAFTFVVVALVTLIAGSVPAAITTRHDVARDLKDRTGQQEQPGSGRWRNALVVAEVALSFALLVGAGLMIRSLADLTSRDPGFEARGVITFTYNLPAERYPDSAQQLTFHRAFGERVRSMPGVEAAGGVFPLPLSGLGFGSRYATDTVTFEDGSARQALYRITYPGYFEAVQASVQQGRTFTQADADGARHYVVVNEALARRAWPDASPLGQTLYIRRGDRPEPAATEVIGVVRHLAHGALDEEPAEAVYLVNSFADQLGFGNGFAWTVRAAGDPQSLIAPLQAELRAMDAGIPLQNVTSLQEIVDQSTAQMRFAVTLITLFGLLALVLAVTGIYGVLAYRVRQRRPELGVRLTFGAAPTSIFALVVRQGMLLVGTGIVVGLAAALALSRTFSSLLVGIGAADPLTYAGIAVVFALVAVAACALPAWRAMRVDPAVTLRYE